MSKKTAKARNELTPEESQKLGMILDRLLVQSPEGMSLDNYLKSLVQTLGNKEYLTVALIEELTRKPSKVSFQAFLMLKGTLKQKSYQKTARQVAYRFAQKGFLESSDTTSQKTVILVPRESREIVSHVMPVLGTFGLFAALIPEDDLSAPTLVTALLENDFERIYVKLMEGSPKIYRDYLQKASGENNERKPCAVPVHHVARLFFELLQWCRNQQETVEIEQARRLLRPHLDWAKPPYAHALMPSLEHPERDVREIDTDRLMSALDLMWLSFDREKLTPYWQKMQDLDSPVLVVPREVQEERSAELLRKAAEEICVDRTRTIYQRFFEEQTLWLKLNGREDLAMEAWTVAQHLAGGFPSGENPVVVRMVALSMQFHWPKEFDQRKEGAEPYYRSESGLILPTGG
jgi:hypothetical protein